VDIDDKEAWMRFEPHLPLEALGDRQVIFMVDPDISINETHEWVAQGDTDQDGHIRVNNGTLYLIGTQTISVKAVNTSASQRARKLLVKCGDRESGKYTFYGTFRRR